MDLFRDNISFSNLLMTEKLIRIDYLTALLQEKNIPERSLGFEKKHWKLPDQGRFKKELRFRRQFFGNFKPRVQDDVQADFPVVFKILAKNLNTGGTDNSHNPNSHTFR